MTKKTITHISVLIGCLCAAIVLIATSNKAAYAEAQHATNLEAAKIKYANKIDQLESLFVSKAVIVPPSVVECTLSEGHKSVCFSITLDVAPGDFTPGPWCPKNINDRKEAGGIWVKDGVTYDVDGDFIKNLPTFYNDSSWQMYDPQTGGVHYTETREECAAAARPDVAPELHNHCVECKVDYMEDGASMTYTIPLDPVALSKPDYRPDGGIGVSFSGAKIETSAPLHAILDAHTLAPFDDCGGHINLHVGYHIHEVTGCLKEYESIVATHAPMIGYAMDGYPLYMKNNQDGSEAEDLDACRGHDVHGLGYHYHVADAGINENLPCLKAQSGCASANSEQKCDASIRRGPPL